MKRLVTSKLRLGHCPSLLPLMSLRSVFFFRRLSVATVAALLFSPLSGQPYTWSDFVGRPPAMGSADGRGSAARFFFPTGIVGDVAGNIYVADTVNSTIRRITPDGTVTTIAGSPGHPGSADGFGSA